MSRIRRASAAVLSALALLLAVFSITEGTGQQARAADFMSLAINRAELFWHSNAPCSGRLVVTLDDASGNIGRTEGCHVHINRFLFGTAQQQAASWPQFCRAVVHEIGHAVLGPDFFAPFNANDPGHSPSPYSVMYFTDPAYPSSCFPATIIEDGRRYRFSLVRGGTRGLIASTVRGHGRLVGRGLIAHPIQRPWFKPSS